MNTSHCISNASVVAASLSTQWRNRCSGGDSAGREEQGPPVSHENDENFIPHFLHYLELALRVKYSRVDHSGLFEMTK